MTSDANGMIKKLNTALVGFAVFVGLATTLPAISASAADDDSKRDDKNIYVSYSGGVSYVRNQRLTGAQPTGADLSGKVESDVGLNVSGAIGMRFHENFRGELELGYHRAEVKTLSVQNEPDDGHGNVSLLSVMANGYIDYDLDIGIVPYVGAGIGWGRVEYDAKNDNGILRLEGEDNVFTWALMIGGSIPVSESIDLSLGYRYIATEDLNLNSSIIRPGPTNAAERLNGEFDSHEGVFALRYKF